MLEFLQTGKALSVLAAIGMIGFVSKLITRSLYKRLLKETDNMAMTRNKNLQNLKQRLENTCRLGQNIVNTQAYLDKQIDGFSFLHISLDAWNGVSMEMVLLGLLTGAAEAFLAYWYELDASYIVLYASAAVMSGLFLAFYRAVSRLTRNSSGWKRRFWSMWIIRCFFGRHVRRRHADRKCPELLVYPAELLAWTRMCGKCRNGCRVLCGQSAV